MRCDMISFALLTRSDRLEPATASVGATSMYTAIPSVQRISCKLHEAPNKQMHPSATRLVLTEWGHLCCYYEAFDNRRIENSGPCMAFLLFSSSWLCMRSHRSRRFISGCLPSYILVVSKGRSTSMDGILWLLEPFLTRRQPSDAARR